LPELQELLDADTLTRIDDTEFAIDALAHRTRTAMGWTDLSYSLHIKDDDEGIAFEIVEEDPDQGDDIVLSSPEPDVVASWITSSIEEKEA
jgi:hypothetical protein